MKQSEPTSMFLSIVIPLYNEEENVEPLYRSLVDVLDRPGESWELVFVDDGSTDATFDGLKRLRERNPAIRIVHLNKNFGQTPALSAGLNAALGDIVITMDGDLQNDPADIPLLLERMREGYDLVCGWRRERKERSLLRKFLSRRANRILAWTTGLPIHDYGCTLRAYRRRIIEELPLYADLHRFIPATASVQGIDIAEIEVRHHFRRHGKSKYGFSRIWKVLFDIITLKLIVQFEGKPFHWFAMSGIPPLILCIVFAVLGFHQFLNPLSDNSPLINFGLCFLLFVLFGHLVILGLISELIVLTGMPRIPKMISEWTGDPPERSERTNRRTEEL